MDTPHLWFWLVDCGMGQTASRPRAKPTKSVKNAPASTSPKSPVGDRPNDTSSDDLAHSSRQSTLAISQEAGNAVESAHSTSRSDEYTLSNGEWGRVPRQSVPTKSGSALRRLSRMLPARLQSTPPEHKRSSSMPINLPVTTPSMTNTIAADIGAEPQSQSQPANSPVLSSTAPEVANVSDKPDTPQLSLSPSSPTTATSAITAAEGHSSPFDANNNDSSSPTGTVHGLKPARSSSSLVSVPVLETEVPAPIHEISQVEESSDSNITTTVSNDPGPLDNTDEVIDNVELASAPAILPGDSPHDVDASSDPLREERRAAAQRILDLIRPAIDTTSDSPTLHSDTSPPPEVVNHIVDQLRSTGDPEIVAALPPSVPARVPSPTRTSVPIPPRAPRQHFGEPSIASGTAMIVQGSFLHSSNQYSPSRFSQQP